MTNNCAVHMTRDSTRTVQEEELISSERIDNKASKNVHTQGYEN